MGEIKSSWEIAKKKADSLGGLSTDEQKKQREERCLPIGKSLADRCLDGRDVREIEKELNKYHDEDKRIIRQVVLRHLVESMDLQHSFALDKATECIVNWTNSEKAAEVIAQIKELLKGYNEMEEVEEQKIEIAGREILHQQRISGSAVDMMNSYAREEWRNRLNEVAQPFEKQLANLKQKLVGLAVNNKF